MAKATNGNGSEIDELKSDEFLCASGLLLELRKVSRFVVLGVGKQIPMPKVPTMYIEDKGRVEENPNDPDYLAAVRDASNERGLFVISTIIALGTRIKFKPEDMEGPEEDDWLDTLEGLSIVDVPRNNQRLRYSAWLRYVGLPDNVEFDKLTTQVLRYSGLTPEEDVQAASDSFRNPESGTTDSERPSTVLN